MAANGMCLIAEKEFSGQQLHVRLSTYSQKPNWHPAQSGGGGGGGAASGGAGGGGGNQVQMSDGVAHGSYNAPAERDGRAGGRSGSARSGSYLLRAFSTHLPLPLLRPHPSLAPLLLLVDCFLVDCFFTPFAPSFAHTTL